MNNNLLFLELLIIIGLLVAVVYKLYENKGEKYEKALRAQIPGITEEQRHEAQYYGDATVNPQIEDVDEQKYRRRPPTRGPGPIEGHSPRDLRRTHVIEYDAHKMAGGRPHPRPPKSTWPPSQQRTQGGYTHRNEDYAMVS